MRMRKSLLGSPAARAPACATAPAPGGTYCALSAALAWSLMAPRASAAVASPFHTLSSAGWISLLVMSTYFGNCGSTLPASVSDRNTSANGALNEALTSALPLIAGTAGEPPDVVLVFWFLGL